MSSARSKSPAIALGIAIALSLSSSVGSAETDINLDGNAANGEESKVSTKVLQTFPIEIENKVVNNAAGKSFTFVWAGAGPGGFTSFLTMGPGVGTKWEWSTVSQVYSIETPVSFHNPREIPVFGGMGGGIQIGGDPVFDVPGKSIYPTQVTLSSAVLTSSLITFFSPENVYIKFFSRYDGGLYQTTALNPLDIPQSVEVEEPDCCKFPRMIRCDGECFFYLTDPDNCGGCGIQCGPYETCVDGVCEPDCPEGLTLCGEECVDTEVDLRHCGGCDNACGENQICDTGACYTCRPPDQTACTLPGLPFQAECTSIHKDPFNCGACGVRCDLLNCPSGGTGACSMGSSCTCEDHPSDDYLDSPFQDTSFDPPIPDEVTEAKVCEAVQFVQEIPAGGSATFCRFLPLLPKEIVTEASTMLGGFRTAGPLVQLVPDFESVIGPVQPTSCGVWIDDGEEGDGLWQPGETADLYFCIQNRGPDSFTNVVGTVSAPATPVISSGIPFIYDTSPIPDLEGFPAGTFDCDSPPPEIPSVHNVTAFTGTLLPGHAEGVGHPVILSLTGSAGATDEVETEDLAVVVGIGAVCDPVTDNDGGTFDRVIGLNSPLNTHLVPEASPVNFSSKGIGRNKTLPLKFTLGCGAETVPAELMDPLPEIVGLENRTTGMTVPLININGGDNANPDDPFFVCGSSRCEYELRTRGLEIGDHIITIRMPDSRSYHAGFTIAR